MENNEIQSVVTTQNTELIVSKESIAYLNETRKWTMFFSILGFVFIGLMAIAAIGMLTAGLIGSSFSGFGGTGLFSILFFLYIIIGVLYLFPVLYLLKFSTNMKSALEGLNSNNLTVAFQNLKSHMKFVGILTIVMIALYILIIFVAILVGLSTLLA
jgi:uncharacterized oligopeptide transporter (OPT) family protein